MNSRRPWVLLGLCAAMAGSACAGSYRLDDADPTFLPPRAVLRLRWHKRLVVQGLFSYRPQEWAAAAIGPQGTVFVGSSAKRFYAIGRDGAVRWRLETAGGIASRPRYDARRKTVFFGADDGKLYAVDARSGKVRWTYATQGTIRYAPALTQGLLLFTTDENRVYAVEASTGRWRWQYDRERPEGFTIRGFSGVLTRGGVAYVGFADGRLVALKVATGEVIWTRSLAFDSTRFIDVDATPVLAGNLLLTACHATGVFALDPETGSIQWQFPLRGASQLTAAGGQVFVTAPKTGIVALSRGGRELWRQAIPKGVPSRPVVVGDYVLVSGTETGLFVAARRSGELLQYFDPGYGISAPPAAGGGLVVVLSNQGRLYTFSLT